MRGWLLAALVIAGPVLAEAPKTSILPRINPKIAAAEPVAILLPSAAPAAVAGGALAVPHPRPRPAGLLTGLPAAQAAAIKPQLIVRPRPKPAFAATELASAAMAPAAPVAKGKKSKLAKQSRKGSVCGDPQIRGEVLAPIGARGKGCGIAEPVKVTSIAGVGFSQPATIDCATARALKTWMIKGMQPAFGNREVVRLHIFGSYMCRSRNNVKGAKISEHGRGKAVDIAGFVFANGKEWTVKRDYNKQIRRAQKAACGIFGTTLGPGSDGYHEDHLHFDTARYRSGSYCR